MAVVAAIFIASDRSVVNIRTGEQPAERGIVSVSQSPRRHAIPTAGVNAREESNENIHDSTAPNCRGDANWGTSLLQRER